MPLHRLPPGQPGRVPEGRGVNQFPFEVGGDQLPPRRGVRNEGLEVPLQQAGRGRHWNLQFRKCISSARYAPAPVVRVIASTTGRVVRSVPVCALHRPPAFLDRVLIRFDTFRVITVVDRPVECGRSDSELTGGHHVACKSGRNRNTATRPRRQGRHRHWSSQRDRAGRSHSRNGRGRQGDDNLHGIVGGVRFFLAVGRRMRKGRKSRKGRTDKGGKS